MPIEDAQAVSYTSLWGMVIPGRLDAAVDEGGWKWPK
jgi:hypothetical protein